MIEVTMQLYSDEEVGMLRDFVAALERVRDTKFVPENFTAGPATMPFLGGIGAPAEPRTETVAPAPAPTREALDRPAPTPVSSSVTQAQLEEALKAYGRAKGFPAARALLDEYTKGKLGDVPAEKHAELYAKLTA